MERSWGVHKKSISGGPIDLNQHFETIRHKLLEQLDITQELSDEQIIHHINEVIIETCKHSYMSLQDRIQLREEIFNSIRKLDVLQELIEDNRITEIMVNGYDQIYIEKGAGIEPWSKQFTSRDKLEDVIQQIVGQCNRVVNESSPIVDARLENGSRVNVVVAPVALNGPILTIRRFPDEPISMSRLIQLESLTVEVSEFLRILVGAGYSVLISGGTSSGKTTFLNALTNFIPKEERIITIEDNAELQVQGINNLVRLEAKNANHMSNESISLRDLIRSALRMRPDRIIVGEVRGEEALDLLQALNTGHDGSLCTAHANSCYDMISRLETMVLMGIKLPIEAIRRQIASGIDIIIQLGKTHDKKRRVLEIVEVVGVVKEEVVLNSLFRYSESEGLLKVDNLRNKEKLLQAGLVYEETI